MRRYGESRGNHELLEGGEYGRSYISRPKSRGFAHIVFTDG